MTATPRQARITLPENPYDGQQVTEEIDEWSVVIWTYDYATNTWSYKVYGGGDEYVVKTEDVVLSRPQTIKVKDTHPQLIGGGVGLLRQHEVNELFINNDTDLQKQVLDERMERVERDLELHHKIDALEAYDETQLREDFEEDQKRQDDELLVDQQRQDKELADYKVLMAKEQADQNKAISDEQSARADADAAHDAQLSTIEYKLDALVGIQFKGLYTFKHDADCDAAYLACLEAAGGDPAAAADCGRQQLTCEAGKVSSGTFEAVDPDDRFDHLEAIVIHKNAKDGGELEWDSILKAGDYLEIDHKGSDGLDKQNYGLYRLTADPVEATNSSGEAVYDMQLEFLQGAGDLVESQDYEVRGITADTGINPEELGDFLQKEEAAATYLPLSGGMMTGNLLSNALFKTTRNTGYAFQVRPNDGDTKALIHTDGHGEFTNRVEVDGVSLSKEGHAHAWSSITGKPSTFPPSSHSHNYAASDHTHSGYASSSHNHDSSYVKGNYTITKTNGNFYIS